jgi:hypothetical protein
MKPLSFTATASFLATIVAGSTLGAEVSSFRHADRSPDLKSRGECRFGQWACLDDFVLNCDATETWRRVADCGAGSGCCAEFNGGAQCIC